MESNPSRCDDVLVALRRIIRAVDLYSKRLERQCNLTGPQLIILNLLANAEELSVSELAARASLSSATVTSILDRLEKRGCVVRDRHPVDRRRVLVRATTIGRELHDRAPSLLQERFVEEFERLQDWEQSLMLSTLQRVASLMEVQDLEAAPMLVSGPLIEATEDSPSQINKQKMARQVPSADSLGGPSEIPGMETQMR